MKIVAKIYTFFVIFFAVESRILIPQQKMYFFLFLCIQNGCFLNLRCLKFVNLSNVSQYTCVYVQFSNLFRKFVLHTKNCDCNHIFSQFYTNFGIKWPKCQLLKLFSIC